MGTLFNTGENRVHVNWSHGVHEIRNYNFRNTELFMGVKNSMLSVVQHGLRCQPPGRERLTVNLNLKDDFGLCESKRKSRSK